MEIDISIDTNIGGGGLGVRPHKNFNGLHKYFRVFLRLFNIILVRLLIQFAPM